MLVPAPYTYPTPNAELIRLHDLTPHFEGGFFKQTIALSSRSTDNGRFQAASGPGTELLSCSTAQSDAAPASSEATCIYYLITPDSPRGRMHMNDNATFHIHHAGRALYTLISQSADGSKGPTVRRVVMGSDPSKGEVTQLFVPGGWWKASEIPDDDLRLLEAPSSDSLKKRIGCLISEVVVPGWTIDQHQFLTRDKLKQLWQGEDGWQAYTPYLSGAPAQV